MAEGFFSFHEQRVLRSFASPWRPEGPVEELLPEIFHWTAFHQGIRQRVSSYYVDAERTLIDPIVPEEGLEWFERRDPRPTQILLTNRHHYRHSDRFVETFGCVVRCHEAGLHEFEGGPAVEPFSFGDRLATGIVALEVGAICPEETALLIEQRDGLLAFADGLIRSQDGSLGFVPDRYLGDDPEPIKQGLSSSFERLLEHDFDNLLFAHGSPLVGGGKRALRTFVGA